MGEDLHIERRRKRRERRCMWRIRGVKVGVRWESGAEW